MKMLRKTLRNYIRSNNRYFEIVLLIYIKDIFYDNQ